MLVVCRAIFTPTEIADCLSGLHRPHRLECIHLFHVSVVMGASTMTVRVALVRHGLTCTFVMVECGATADVTWMGRGPGITVTNHTSSVLRRQYTIVLTHDELDL